MKKEGKQEKENFLHVLPVEGSRILAPYSRYQNKGTNKLDSIWEALFKAKWSYKLGKKK